MLTQLSCSRTFYLSMCSSEYKNPDFVGVCVFMLYVEITHLAGPIWSIVARHHTHLVRQVSEILSPTSKMKWSKLLLRQYLMVLSGGFPFCTSSYCTFLSIQSQKIHGSRINLKVNHSHKQLLVFDYKLCVKPLTVLYMH